MYLMDIERKAKPQYAEEHTPENHEYTDGVFVHIFHGRLRVEVESAFLAHRYKPALDLKVSSEFFKSYLSIGTHDNIRSDDDDINKTKLEKKKLYPGS